jgi:hypothetical protein
MQGGIFQQSGAFIGLKLLDTAFNLVAEAQSLTFEQMISQYGVILQRQSNGTYSTEGKGTAAVLNLTINAFNAIVKDSDGLVKAIRVATNQTIDFSTYADGTWKVLAQVKKINTETGTITLTNGSKNVTGIGTTFTKRLGKKLTIVILDSVSGNNNAYEIESVTDDTHAVLRYTFTGTTETTLPFSIGTIFPDANYQPSTISGFRTYEMNSYEFVITQSAVATHQLYLCSVVKATGALTVTDQRTALKFSPHIHTSNDIYGGDNIVLTSGDQSIAGVKTFRDSIIVSSDAYVGYNKYRLSEVVSGDIHDIQLDSVGFGMYWNESANPYFRSDSSVIQVQGRNLVIGASAAFKNDIIFYNTENGFKLTLTHNNATASDKTIVFPNLSGTVIVSGQNAVLVDVTVDILRSNQSALIDSYAIIGKPLVNDGVLFFYNAYNNLHGAIKATLISTTSKEVLLPNANGTIALVDAGQNFTNIAEITANNLTLLGDRISLPPKISFVDPYWGITTELLGWQGDGECGIRIQNANLTQILNVWNNGSSSGMRLTNGFIALQEMTTPSTAPANEGYLFMKDNGAGKTQLCVIFSSGATQVLATQP